MRINNHLVLCSMHLFGPGTPSRKLAMFRGAPLAAESKISAAPGHHAVVPSYCIAHYCIAQQYRYYDNMFKIVFVNDQ